MNKKSHASWLTRIRQWVTHHPPSDDALITAIQKAKESALIDQDSYSMITGVLKLAHMTVADAMIPRSQMDILESDMTIEKVLPIVIKSAHSRFPVLDINQNKVIGILLAKDLLQLMPEVTQEKTIQHLLRSPICIPESKRLNVLLKEFRLKHNHMAIVIDEYGNADGLITIEDVLEEIVGSIVDEYDADEGTQDFIKQHDAHLAEVNALTPLNEFNIHFGKHFSDERCDTIGGYVLQAFNHLPKEGETIELEDLEITVLKATDRGIKQLRIYKNLSTKEH